MACQACAGERNSLDFDYCRVCEFPPCPICNRKHDVVKDCSKPCMSCKKFHDQSDICLMALIRKGSAKVHGASVELSRVMAQPTLASLDDGSDIWGWIIEARNYIVSDSNGKSRSATGQPITFNFSTAAADPLLVSFATVIKYDYYDDLRQLGTIRGLV